MLLTGDGELLDSREQTKGWEMGSKISKTSENETTDEHRDTQMLVFYLCVSVFICGFIIHSFRTSSLNISGFSPVISKPLSHAHRSRLIAEFLPKPPPALIGIEHMQFAR